MNVIMYRLRKNGRAAVILPDGFLFGTDKLNIKKKLMNEFNLHTVIRMPHKRLCPLYFLLRTNILFFDNTEPTKETWFYHVDMPEGYYKNFSKTRPMKLEHFNDALAAGKPRRNRSGWVSKAKRYQSMKL